MLVFYAVMLTMLLGFVGLAVDVGRVELRSQQLQAAADAGALSGATEWAHLQAYAGKVPVAAVTNAAYTDALATEALNNYPNSTAITSQLTASTGPYATDYAAVQTTITQSVPTFFLKLLPGGATAATVTVKALADAPPCMYFFSSPAGGGGGGIELASAGINLSCPIYVKGTPIIDGFSTVNYNQIKSSAALSGAAPGGGSSTYPPFWNYPVLTDPLAYVTAPTYTGCDNVIRVNIILPGQILQPGRYCGLLGFPGISVSGVPVTMAPGLYIVTGGVNFQNTTVTGSGVTIYMTKGGLAGYGIFSAQNSMVNLTAPTLGSGGSITGVSLFTDRNWVGGNQDVQFQTTRWTGDGIIYSMDTGINSYASVFSAPNYMNMVVANEYSYLGTIYSAANYATVSGGSPLHNAVNLVQ